MAIEDDEPRDRETWSNVARFWYNKAADKSPTIGRLYHHLAILARPYSLEQLSLYTRALTCVTPFESARGSVMTLFNPILHGKDTAHRRLSSLETIFIRAHGILFTTQRADSNDQFNATVDELEQDGLFDKYTTKCASRFKETGVHTAVSNIAALFEFGIPKQGGSKSTLRLAFEDALRVKAEAAKPVPGQSMDPGNPTSFGMDPKYAAGLPEPNVESLVLSRDQSLWSFISQALRLTSITLGTSLKRTKDKNVYPLVHIYLAFLWSLIIVQEACRYFEKAVVWRVIERDIPWIAVCYFLNELAAEPQAMTEKVWAEEFPRPDTEKGRPLAEDFVMRGQMYSLWLYPRTWFTDPMVDDDERTHDPPSMTQPRMERILWLGHRIASVCSAPFMDALR